MTFFQKILVVGFAIAIIGWCIGGFLGQREIGVSVFIIGFAISVFGLVGSNLNITFPSDDKLHMPSIGLKIGTIGFGISCLSVLSSFFVDLDNINNYIFIAGFILVVIGVSIMIRGIKKNQ
jgi:predicted tellurium resistance membrane protein TerC